MTRTEFLDEVNDFCELICFCSDHDIYICDDIYDEDEMDDWLNEHLNELANSMDWGELKDYLNEVPCDSGYYYRQDGDYFCVADAEFDDYKNAVLEEMDRNGDWDEEELPEPEDISEFEEEEIELPISELICSCKNDLSANRPKTTDEALTDLMNLWDAEQEVS